jgi:hypothetical protein
MYVESSCVSSRPHRHLSRFTLIPSYSTVRLTTYHAYTEVTTKKIPKDGWVRELEHAESAAKRSRSAGAQLHLAIATYKLRDFRKLKTATNRGLALDPSEGEQELLLPTWGYSTRS